MIYLENKYLLFFVIFLFIFSLKSTVVNSKPPENLEHLLQMPVAVNRASEIGISNHTLEEIASGLNRGQLSPAQFNAFLQQTPALAESFKNVNRVGSFITSKVRAGLRGEELASNLQQELRRLGIPSAGLTEPGPAPLEQKNYFSSQSKVQIRRAIEAQRKNKPEAPSGSSAPPGGPSPPGMQPGMDMPGATP